MAVVKSFTVDKVPDSPGREGADIRRQMREQAAKAPGRWVGFEFESEAEARQIRGKLANKSTLARVRGAVVYLQAVPAS